MDDPFAAHMAPPEGETAPERALRLAAQQNAEKTSRQIDEALLQSKKMLDKKRQDVKILLLGIFYFRACLAESLFNLCLQGSRNQAKSVLASLDVGRVLIFLRRARC